MNRHLALLLGLALAALAPLAGTTIEPDSYYRAVVACDRPANFPEPAWQNFSDNVRNADKGAGLMRIEGNTLLLNFARVSGSELTNTLGKNFQGLVPRLVSAEKLGPSQAELDKAKREQEAARQKLADENDPRRTVDAKGKPIYNAGSPEAEAQLRESAREQDKSAAKFKQYNKWGTNGPASPEEKPVRDTGAFDEDFPKDGGGKAKSAPPADFPEEEDKRPLSQRIMNTGKKPAPAAAVAPAAQADDEADEPPLAASGSKFSKPKPGQGTRKDDTLFKSQNQNSSGQFMAPDNFIAIWAHPQDRGTGAEQDRLVLVELTDSPKPVGLTLWQAKSRKYVPQDFKYSSLRVFPQ